MRPRPFDGRFLRARRVVGWSLVALFVSLPFLRVARRPAVLLDIPARQFLLFGATLRATDGVLLMLALLAVFIGIFALTAWKGRAWCGWACPQTVYMEFLFRPLERWIEGGRAAQLRLDREGPNARRLLKYPVFALLSVVLANVFLSYFVGVQKLGVWMTSSPFTHPTGFLVLLVTSLAIFADFGYFREQMCTVACPYARLQSVLLDTRSKIVGYDRQRGEPRGRGTGSGDCVDCGACVVACPTGIDIRDGLQIECIACAQCVDACDSVMLKFKRPLGLIRHASARELQPTPASLAPRHSRAALYAVLFAGLMGALFFFSRGRGAPEVTLLRGIGAPFDLEGDQVRNQIRIKIQNRSNEPAAYHLELLGLPEARLIAPEDPLPVAAGDHAMTSVFVVVPRSALPSGSREVEFQVSDGQGLALQVPYRVLGPQMLQNRRAGP